MTSSKLPSSTTKPQFSFIDQQSKQSPFPQFSQKQNQQPQPISQPIFSGKNPTNSSPFSFASKGTNAPTMGTIFPQSVFQPNYSSKPNNLPPQFSPSTFDQSKKTAGIQELDKTMAFYDDEEYFK